MARSAVDQTPYSETSDSTHGHDLTLAQRIDPVLVPKQIQQLGIQTRLEHGDLQLVVCVGVNSKVFDLVKRYGLIFVGGCVGWGISLE